MNSDVSKYLKTNISVLKKYTHGRIVDPEDHEVLIAAQKEDVIQIRPRRWAISAEKKELVHATLVFTPHEWGV